MHFHWIDYAIIAMVALSMLTGVFRGFIKELVALSVWIMAIWLGMNYSEPLAQRFTPYINEPTLRFIAAFAGIFIASLIAGSLANTMLSFLLKRSGLNGTDRLLGMGFGLIRGVFIVSLLMLVVDMTSIPHQEYSRESRLYNKFTPLVRYLYKYTPDFIKRMQLFDKTELATDISPASG